MPNVTRYVEFLLDSLHIAFALDDIRRVVRAVAVTRVPGASHCVMGVINVHGEVIPLFDTRVLLGQPSRAVRASDHILIARGSQPRAFVADQVLGSFECPEVTAPQSFMTCVAGMQGVAKRADGMILVHDIKRFMALDIALPMELVRE